MSNKHFETSDLGLATALVTFGHPLEALNRNDPHRVVFSFTRTAGLDEVVQEFWQRNLKIEPLAYFNNIKLMKNRIYSR